MNFPRDKYLTFQDGLKRFETAMQGVPDRVPVFAQLHDFARKEIGAAAVEFYTHPEMLIAGLIETSKKWRIDLPGVDYDVYNIEAEALGQRIIYNADHIPDIDRTQPLIRDRGDLSKIRTPDFEGDGRFPHVIKMYSLFRERTNIEPTLNFCAPFTLAANLRGIQQLIVDIYSDPDFAENLFSRITEEVLIPWIQFLKGCFPGAKAICGSDAMSSLPIVNMDILKNWSAHYIQRLREVCGPEVYVPNWVGERYLKLPERMLELKLQVCPHFLEGQDPDVSAIGPHIYKQYAQEKNVPLITGIGSSFMARSKPEAIKNRIKHYIEVGGKDGRFCLYLCNIDSATPVENLQAAMDAVHRYGNY